MLIFLFLVFTTTYHMTDVGARSSTSPYSHMWPVVSSFWQLAQVPEHWRELYRTLSENCKQSIINSELTRT